MNHGGGGGSGGQGDKGTEIFHAVPDSQHRMLDFIEPPEREFDEVGDPDSSPLSLSEMIVVRPCVGLRDCSVRLLPAKRNHGQAKMRNRVIPLLCIVGKHGGSIVGRPTHLVFGLFWSNPSKPEG